MIDSHLDELERMAALHGALVPGGVRLAIKRFKIPSYLVPNLAVEMAALGNVPADDHLKRINAGRATYRFIPIEVDA